MCFAPPRRRMRERYRGGGGLAAPRPSLPQTAIFDWRCRFPARENLFGRPVADSPQIGRLSQSRRDFLAAIFFSSEIFFEPRAAKIGPQLIVILDVIGRVVRMDLERPGFQRARLDAQKALQILQLPRSRIHDFLV